MLVQKQLNRHRPSEGVYGDCHRTAFAAMFDIQAAEVPHFAENFKDGVEFDRRVTEWLAGQGYAQFHTLFACDDLSKILDYMKTMNPGIYYLLGGQSKTGVDHTVVCCDDQIVCDPSQVDSGIVGPCGDGHFWVTIFVPDRFTNRRREEA